MLNTTTMELIALWVSSSASLLAFCFSQLIIAVLLLGGRGECAAAGAGEDEMLSGGQFQSSQTSNSGGREDSAVASDVGDDSGCVSFSANTTGRAAAGAAAQVQLQASHAHADGGREGASVSAEYAQQEASRCNEEEQEEDDEEIDLMTRAEELIQRMNRAWRTENLRAC